MLKIIKKKTWNNLIKQNKMLQDKVLEYRRNDNDIKNKAKAEVVREEMYKHLKLENASLKQENEQLLKVIETLKNKKHRTRKKKEDAENNGK